MAVASVTVQVSATSPYEQLRGLVAEVLSTDDHIKICFPALQLILPLLPDALEAYLREGVLTVAIHEGTGEQTYGDADQGNGEVYKQVGDEHVGRGVPPCGDNQAERGKGPTEEGDENQAEHEEVPDWW